MSSNFTDSTNVHRYIANHVQTIRDFSSPAQWRYMEDNPADYASRSLQGPSLLRQHRWLKGPVFLWKPEKEWPEQAFTMEEVPDNDPEVNQVVSTCATVVEDDDSPFSLFKLIEHYSNWYLLKKAVAVFLHVQKTRGFNRRRLPAMNWLIYQEGQGMFCLLCRKHGTTNYQHKSKKYNLEPAVRFKRKAVEDHANSQQHAAAVTAELLSSVSTFAEVKKDRNH